MSYIERSAKVTINKLRDGFPIVVISGPRQSGKTTYLKRNFSDYSYFNLELPSTLKMIVDDPLKFLSDYPRNLILDEVQRFPELLSYLQVHVDELQELGTILLSGSQNLLISEKISQSLAGRAAYQTLLPLSFQEIFEHGIEIDYNEFIIKGGYPALYNRNVDVGLYFEQYIATYLERDVRELKSVQDLLLFQKFMRILAGRVGQIISESAIANDVGVSPNTISSWISILEASYIVFRLQPYYNNHSKRLIKSPKIYFTDTGLLCRLLSIDTINELKQHFAYGSIFENMVINEIRKNKFNSSSSDRLYFYRDSNGNEVDLIVDKGIEQVPIEIKSAHTYNSNFSKGLNYWRRHYNPDSTGLIIYGGSENFSIKKNNVISFSSLVSTSI